MSTAKTMYFLQTFCINQIEIKMIHPDYEFGFEKLCACNTELTDVMFDQTCSSFHFYQINVSIVILILLVHSIESQGSIMRYPILLLCFIVSIAAHI